MRAGRIAVCLVIFQFLAIAVRAQGPPTCSVDPPPPQYNNDCADCLDPECLGDYGSGQLCDLALMNTDCDQGSNGCYRCKCSGISLYRCRKEDECTCEVGNSDGYFCTVDLCQNGSCVPGPECPSDPAYPCRLNICIDLHPEDPYDTRHCQTITSPVGSPCDNGIFCDGPDDCKVGGYCQPTQTPDDARCPDNFCEISCNEEYDRCEPPEDCSIVGEGEPNACTRDWCENGSCQHELLDCDVDGNVCNGIEGCDTETGCYFGEPLNCDDGIPCTDDSCHPISGCQIVNNARSCDDGDMCTENDQCQGGACLGTPRACNDGTVCTTDSCDHQTGCQFVPVTCDDGPLCLIGRCDPMLEDCVYECVQEPVPEELIPKADDRTFVYVDDEELSADETYVANGTNGLGVTRYAGLTIDSPNGGQLVHAWELKSAELATDATLTIVAWGVQVGSSHAVYFNGGAKRGDLQVSPDCTWSSTTFPIPLEDVKFPGARGDNGQKPVAEPNEVKIVVGGTPTCLRFRAAILSVKLMSPIILIHGNNQEGSFFVDRGFTAGLDQKHLLWDNSINLPTNPREVNARRLNDNPDGPNEADIPAILTSFGVDGVHLVAHSKGGLDAREYLERYYPSRKCVGGVAPGAECSTDFPCEGEGAVCKRPFDVLSLTTLSTPHNGSVLADIAEERLKAIKNLDRVEYPEFPFFTEKVAAANEGPLPDIGRPDLQTTTCGDFNFTNGPYMSSKLAATMTFNAVGADADLNGNGQIDSVPDEYAALREESTELMNKYNTYGKRWMATAAVETIYWILRNVPTIKVTRKSRDKMGGQIGGMEWYTIIEEAPNSDPTPLPNDTFVTVSSALGIGTYSKLISPPLGQSVELPRPAPPPPSISGRNHASIADSGIAILIIPWIRDIESGFGDLR